MKYTLIVSIFMALIGCQKDKDPDCENSSENSSENSECQPSDADDQANLTNPPEVFQILAATPGDGSVEISWSASLYASSYVVTRGTTDGIYDATAGTTTDLIYQDTGLSNGTTYFYMVAASNAAGTIQATERIAVTPVAAEIPTMKVKSSVSGLSGTLVLHINGGNAVTVSSDGSFSFPIELSEGENFTITIASQPAQQTCSVENSTGKIGKDDIANIKVTCSFSAFTVGGNISGLSGTVVLSNNGGDDLSINANGVFTFPGLIADGADYEVAVKTQPTGMHCSLTNEAGTIGGANVSNVTVACENAFTVGGSVSGMADGTLVLRNNGGNDLSLTADGAFTFTAGLVDGAAYSVSVHTNPAGHSCTVTSGSGTIAGSNVTSVTVNCIHSIVLFATGNFSGNLGNRAAIDGLCSARATALSLSCPNVRALISIDTDDEVRDMPDLYGVPTNVPLRGPTGKLFHSTWVAALGGSEAVNTLEEAEILTGSPFWWSGSTSSGALDPGGLHCDHWTDGGFSYGAIGNKTVKVGWLSVFEDFCDSTYPLLCLCY
ncbi:MAG: hypothetical protein ACOH5I_25250 [Oligoflexus sp.]